MLNHSFLLICCSCIIGSLQVTYAFAEDTTTIQKNENIATAVARHYLESFSNNTPTKEKKLATKKNQIRQKKAISLNEFTQRAIVLNALLAKGSKLAHLQQQPLILNHAAWDDLKLFYGTTSQPNYHLMSRINKTVTTLGECVLATMLVTPTHDIQVLQQRQHIIKMMGDNPTQLQKLQAYLHEYKAAEQSLLSLWSEDDPLYSPIYMDYINRKFYFKNQKANQSAIKLAVKKIILCDLLSITVRITYPLFLISAPPATIPIYNLYHMSTTQAAVNKPLVILQNLGYLWSLNSGITSYRDCAGILHYLALRMAALQSFVKAAQQVNEYVANDSALEALYGEHLGQLRNLLHQKNNGTALGKFIRDIQHMPLKKWSYFFSNSGKLLASYQIFLAHKDVFSNAFYDFGQLDAFMSIAQLMQEAQIYSDNAYVFTQFLDRKAKTKPYIQFTDMWNLFMDAKKNIPNSITMDAENGMRTMILTGPNAGGKSTFLTGVTMALLLSQTFGIAPAKAAVITPFNKINTYINIVDDIAAGKSMFMAEVDRAQKHIKILESLHSNEFSFSIMDELFSGTNPKEGEAAAYSIMDYMGIYKNTINIIATHFPRAMLLEKNAKDKGFMNYKVFITYKGPQKKLNYTYKIVPGKSNQTIALDILEEQGYNTKMLEKAADIIAHPKRYPISF